MKAFLAISAACLLALQPSAQMDHMDHSTMPGMQHGSSAASAPMDPNPQAPTKQVQQHAPMPFGRTADGDDSRAPRKIPVVDTPVALTPAVQEQEHPAQRTGATEVTMPDLLADVHDRAPLSLDAFTQQALASNPTLREAEAQVRRLQAQAKQAGLWSNPEVGYEADHIRGGAYHSGEQGGYVQQVIPLGGQQSSARAATQAQVQQAERVVQAQQERVRSAVAQAFYAALAVQQEVALRQELAELAVNTAVGMHQFANIGQADAPDLLQSEVEREQARLDLMVAQRSYRKSFALLAALTGDSGLPVAPLAGDLQRVPEVQGSAASVAESSPTLQVAQQQISASDAAIRSAQRQQRPQLVLHAGLQQDNEPLEVSGGRVGVVGVAQAGVTLPLWNRNQGAVAAARAERESASAEASRTRLTLRMQAEQAMQDYQTARTTVQTYQTELLPRAERSYALYQVKYAQMAAAYPQLVLSHRTLLQLRVEYVRTLAAAWQSAILLQHGLLSDGLLAPAQVGTAGQAASGGAAMR